MLAYNLVYYNPRDRSFTGDYLGMGIKGQRKEMRKERGLLFLINRRGKEGTGRYEVSGKKQGIVRTKAESKGVKREN